MLLFCSLYIYESKKSIFETHLGISKGNLLHHFDSFSHFCYQPAFRYKREKCLLLNKMWVTECKFRLIFLVTNVMFPVKEMGEGVLNAGWIAHSFWGSPRAHATNCDKSIKACSWGETVGWEEMRQRKEMKTSFQLWPRMR